MCYEIRSHAPLAPPFPVRAYFWNERCLHAPRPYIDKNGIYFHFEKRRVIPGTLPMSKGFQPMSRNDIQMLFAASVRMVKNTNQAIDKLFKKEKLCTLQ